MRHGRGHGDLVIGYGVFVDELDDRRKANALSSFVARSSTDRSHRDAAACVSPGRRR
jgi:hypothetical protein